MKTQINQIKVGDTVRGSDTYDTCTFVVEKIQVFNLKNGKKRYQLSGTSKDDRTSYDLKRKIENGHFSFALRAMNETSFVNKLS